ncbi:DUF3667 domain-containing protein [Flavobacterium sasangense]|jgi:hypothetical protein|uniref:DUF3667 domain-containing protein n=1 Tax=Flavobacterium sasangense TaxID=503361 RepID=UPI00047D3584|nr:DUF3667 domain-containing protein [Flavobacterium sasangense]
MNRKDKKYRGTQCINCETKLDVSEKYCHACGQLNSTKKLTIRDFIEEFFANFYAYDSRLRNTFFSLFLKPGIAAREFCEGKRHHHANPFRLFLSISIILFIVMDFGSSIKETPSKTKEPNKNSITSDSLKTSKVFNRNPEIVEVDPKTAKEFHRDSIYKANELGNDPENLSHLNLKLTIFRNYNIKNPNLSNEEALKNLGFENKNLNRYLYEKAKSLKSNDVLREAGDYILGKLPFLIFLSIPFIAIIFWIAFYDKKFNYTDHLVFSYNFYSFMFICLILFEFVGFISEDISLFLVGISFSILFPIYLYKSLRNFYQNSRWKTIFKFLLLNILFIPISLLAVFVLMAVSIILF